MKTTSACHACQISQPQYCKSEIGGSTPSTFCKFDMKLAELQILGPEFLGLEEL